MTLEKSRQAASPYQGSGIAARTDRTTPIAAHYLRLAAQGHFNADVTLLREALLCTHDPACWGGAVGAALDAGNDHFFLNLSMAACKAMLDAAANIPGSSMVTAMARQVREAGAR